MVTGIYIIENIFNNHRYVGSSTDLDARWYKHKQDAKKNRHTNAHFQHAWNKYGQQAFEFKVLEVVPDVNDLVTIEQYYIDWLEPEYNICPVAGNCLGRVCSEQHRARISASHKGKILSEEHKAKLSQAHIGKPLSQLHREHIGAALCGRHLSTETIAKIKATNMGKCPSEATLTAAHRATKGKPLSKEHRAKLSAAHKGKKLSDEHRAKLSKAAKRRYGHLSEE